MTLAEKVKEAFPGCPFGGPATPEDIQRAESELREPLPSVLRDLYLAFDGFRSPTNARYFWPLFGKEPSLVQMNGFLRFGDEFPQELVRSTVFFGDEGIGPYWGIKRDLPGKVIRWDAEWGEDIEIVGTTPLDAWLQSKRDKLDRFNSRLAFANANGPVYDGETADLKRIVFLDPPIGNTVGKLLCVGNMGEFFLAPSGEVRFRFGHDARSIYVNRGVAQFQAAARVFNAFNWSMYDPDDYECEYFEELTTRFAAAIQQVEPLGDPNESLWSAIHRSQRHLQLQCQLRPGHKPVRLTRHACRFLSSFNHKSPLRCLRFLLFKNSCPSASTFNTSSGRFGSCCSEGKHSASRAHR